MQCGPMPKPTNVNWQHRHQTLGVHLYNEDWPARVKYLDGVRHDIIIQKKSPFSLDSYTPVQSKQSVQILTMYFDIPAAPFDRISVKQSVIVSA